MVEESEGPKDVETKCNPAHHVCVGTLARDFRATRLHRRCKSCIFLRRRLQKKTTWELHENVSVRFPSEGRETIKISICGT